MDKQTQAVSNDMSSLAEDARALMAATIVFFRLLFVFALCWLALPANAATRSWTGDGPLINGAYKLWSDPANWDPQGAPQNGEDLWFLDSFSADLQMFNDLPNLTVRSLRLAIGDIGDASVHLHGNTLGVSEGLFNIYDFECQVYIHCGVRLAGNATFVTGNTADQPFAGEDTAMHLIGPIDLNGHNLVIYADASYFGSAFGDNSGRMFVEGGISGAGNVAAIAGGFQQGAEGILYAEGSIEFKGAGSSFAGTLTLNSRPNSEILFNVSSGVVVNNLLIVTNVGTVKLARSEQIGDGATVRLKDGATLQLNGRNETFQNLELITDSNDSRPAVLDAGSGTLSLQGNITSTCNNSAQTPAIKGKLHLLSGSHVINVSGSVYSGLDMQAQMLGFGNFSKSGNSALLLQASNSFNSTITILQGVLDVRNNHGLGDIAGSTEILGGNLTLRNLAIGAELLFALGGTGGEFPGSALTSIGVSSWAGQVALYTNLVVTGDMTFTGPISGPGGLGCFGGGTIRLGGTLANTYTGTTLVRCPLVEFNKPYDVRAFAGPLVVGGEIGGPSEARWMNYYQNRGGTLTLYANGLANVPNVVEEFRAITFNGGRIETALGSINLGNPFTTDSSTITVNPNAATAIINGNLALYGGPANFIVGNGAAEPDLLVNAIVGGPSRELSKQGAGTMRMTGPNTYFGVTRVNEGVLVAGQGFALGDSNVGTIVAPGGTLRLEGIDTITERFELYGPGAGTLGSLDVTVGGTLTGPVVLGSATRIHTMGSLAIEGVISGTGPLTKTGPGNLFLGGVSGGAENNTYSGNTVVLDGTLYLSKNQGVVAVPGNLVVGPATSALNAVARFSRSGTMPPAGTVTVNANSLLDLNGNNQLLSQLNLNDGGDAQTGAGTLSFTGGGAVTVGTMNSPPTGLRASASISGRIAAPTQDYLVFNIAPYGSNPLVPDPELVVSAQIAGTESYIAKNGIGTMRLSGNNTFAGSASILTEFNINAGTVVAASPTALGGADNWVYVINGASLAIVGNIIINNKPLYLNSTNPAALDNRGGDNIWIGPISFGRDSGISVNFDWSLTVQGVVSGTGSLIKRGGGLLRLSGAANNTHAGDTYVDEGFLYLTKSANLQAVPANLIIGRSGGGTFATARHFGQDQIWANITVNRGGLLDVNGFVEWGGDLALNGGGDVQTGAGALHIANLLVNPGGFADQSVISGRLGLYPGAHLFTIGSGSPLSGDADCLVSANIIQYSTSASLEKTGAGVLRLTGNNAQAGATTLSAGTLWVDGVQAQSPVQVSAGTLLKGSGTIGQITLNGSASSIAPGAGPGILTTSNFNAGALGASSLIIELNGATPGGGHDQVNVRGAVNLTGIALNSTLGFASAASNQFTIINNDGADAVTGTFTGLPQNGGLSIGGERFQISYTGGSGNDVVLTRLATPARPTLTIQRVPPASVRLEWPTNAPPFRLQSNTNLATASWITVSPPPAVLGANNVVTNAVSSAQNFYRLVNP